MNHPYSMDEYLQKRRSVQEALSGIRSGQRIFVGSLCGEPQHLVNTLLEQRRRYNDLEILRLFSLEGAITSSLADQEYGHDFTIRPIYEGAGSSEEIRVGRRFLCPMNAYLIPRLFRSKQLPINCALIQVSPPDQHGWMSLGISVDITKAAALAADVVVAQVNPLMPRVSGPTFLHVHDMDWIVEKEEPLLTLLEVPEPAASEEIARAVANLVEDGATIQLGLGEAYRSILQALAGKNDLGIHTQYMTDGIMELMERGVVTNRHKFLHYGMTIATGAVGSEQLYRYLDGNPAVEFHSTAHVDDPVLIMQNHRMVAINMATAIDLTGQVSTDALPQNHFAGVTAMPNFMHAAAHSVGGKAIMVMTSTTEDGKRSRIVPELESSAVTISRRDVYHVVTEYGTVNLFGKNIQERAMALISIAHPDFREELFNRAKETGLIGRERSLYESLFGIYPVHIEETRVHAGVPVTFRPMKPGDLRILQGHFYAMDEKDVTSRFFHFRTAFHQDQLESMYQIDYLKNMTIVAVTDNGMPAEKVIGVGEYVREGGKHMAEVAFSLRKEWQGKGVAGVILEKLAQAANENGIEGLVAYTSPRNASMIKLFKKLPYPVETHYDGEFFILKCLFARP